MKTLIVLLAVIVCAAGARGQETSQAEIKIENASPAALTTSGNVWLTGNRMICLVRYRSAYCYRSAAIHGPAGRGTNGPVIFPLETYFPCQNGQINHSRNEFLLTDEQVEQLRAGLWYVLLDNDSDQIVLDRVCRYMPTNAIEFSAVMRGRTPAGIQLSYVRCGLTGDNFSYEITVAADFGPYGALIWDENGYANFEPIVVDLGTVECLPIASSNLPPNAASPASLPQCGIRGAVCVPNNYIDGLLRGRWQLTLGDPRAPFNYEGGLLKPVDNDKDGVPDYLDRCPATATNSLINADGCSLKDLCPCDGPWKNHGEYLKCLKDATKDFQRAGLITEKERKALMKQGERSDCGKKNPHNKKPEHGGR